MIPFGQQCKECTKPSDDEEQIYLLPRFLTQPTNVVEETIEKIYEKVVAKYYGSRSFEDEIFYLPKKISSQNNQNKLFSQVKQNDDQRHNVKLQRDYAAEKNDSVVNQKEI